MGIFTDNPIINVGGQLRPVVSGTGGGGSGYDGSYTNNTSQDQVIQGKMLTVTNVIKLHDWEMLTEQHIKRKMIYELAEEMARTNLIEFTRQNDPVTHCINVRARCFMVPDTLIRILRKNGIK